MNKKNLLIGLLILGIAAGVYFVFLVRTPFGHRAVIWSAGGVSYEERAPGWSFIFRPLQQAYLVDVREQKYVTVFGPDAGENAGKSNAFVQSSDLQEIKVKGTVVFQIDPTQAAEIYDNIGIENLNGIIESVFFDAIKEASGQVTAEAFAQQLGPLAVSVMDIIKPELAARGVIVKSVLLEDAVFDPEFVQSVKNKVIALQREQETETLVRVADNEARAIRLVGEAEADVQQAIADAVTIEAVCYELAKQGVRCVPDVVAGTDTPFIYELPPGVDG